MRCKTCHYDLTRLSEHRCPECGRAFDPADRRTFEGQPTLLGRMTRKLPLAGLVLLIVCAIFGGVLYWLMSSVLGGEYW